MKQIYKLRITTFHYQFSLAKTTKLLSLSRQGASLRNRNGSWLSIEQYKTSIPVEQDRIPKSMSAFPCHPLTQRNYRQTKYGLGNLGPQAIPNEKPPVISKQQVDRTKGNLFRPGRKFRFCICGHAKKDIVKIFFIYTRLR